MGPGLRETETGMVIFCFIKIQLYLSWIWTSSTVFRYTLSRWVTLAGVGVSYEKMYLCLVAKLSVILVLFYLSLTHFRYHEIGKCTVYFQLKKKALSFLRNNGNKMKREVKLIIRKRFPWKRMGNKKSISVIIINFTWHLVLQKPGHPAFSSKLKKKCFLSISL